MPSGSPQIEEDPFKYINPRFKCNAIAVESRTSIENIRSPVRDYSAARQKGKTPVLTADEARELLDAIDTSTIVGLRDRALIALMTFTFARVGAAAGKMRVEDVYVQGRRTWVRLHEKGGKRHEMPLPSQVGGRFARLDHTKRLLSRSSPAS
jgi:integrase